MHALAIFRAVGADPAQDIASALNDLGVTLRAQGDFDGALNALKEARKLRSNPISPNGELQLAETLNNLANVYRQRQQFELAHEAMEASLKIRRALLPAGHALLVQSLNNLALLHHAMGDLKSALPLLQKALEINKEALGETHPEYASCLNSLAIMHNAAGDQKAALAMYLKALAIEKKTRLVGSTV